MLSIPRPVKVAAFASVSGLVLVTIAVWVLRGYVWPGLSNTEVDALRAMLDPTLFRRDFAVQECLPFTPRFYYNAVILLPARAGLPLEWVFALWQLVAIGTLLSGLRALGRALGMGEAATALLVVWLLTVGVGTVGGVYLYTHAPVPAVWAGALVAWGASWAWRRRWLMAYTFFGGAVLLQFLVGFYAGLLTLPALLWTGWRREWPALGPWVLGLLLVYVPMRLAGGTGSDALNDTSFVTIYAQLRLPHHLVPSTWGWAVWVQAGAFYIGGWWLLRRLPEGRPGYEPALLAGAIGLAVAALGLNYVFVEVHPLALAAKLQPARITPLVQGLALILLATRVQALIARRDWVGAAILGLIPFSLVPGFLLLLAAILLPPKNGRGWAHAVLAVAVLLSFQPLDASIAARGLRYGLWLAIFGVQLLPSLLRQKPWWLAGLALAAVTGAAACAVASRGENWPAFLRVRFSVNAAPIEPAGRLGLRFGRNSPKDALVLAPPAGDSWMFKLYARRAVVVDDKNAPFTDRGLKEWKKRMEQVLGVPLEPGGDGVLAWRSRPPEDLRAVAEHFGARYVLTRDAWHDRLPGRKIDHEADWSLWELPEPGHQTQD